MVDVAALRADLSHENHQVRMQAVRRLACEDVSEAGELLLKMMNDEHSLVVRTVIRLLGKCRYTNALPKLEALLAHDSLWVRKAVVEVFGMLGDSQVVPLLVDLLEDDDLESLAREALIKLKVDPDFF